ncbi:MAG TPA: Gfo/Idh/MocA family oxidoreductase [Limnochordia bacterium]
MARQDWGIGIVGLGGISRQHVEGYRRQGLRIVGGADINPDRAASARTQMGLGFVTTDVEALIQHPEVRIVDVTAPHHLEVRRPIVEAAARHKKAVFIQKPLLPVLSEARILVEIAEAAGIPLMVNQNSIFVPGFQAVEPYLRDPAYIGTPYYFQIENRGWSDVSDHPWFGKSERWIISDMGIHHFALIRHWFGDPEAVYAIAGRDPSQAGIKGENLAVLALKFPSGLQGIVINNWCYRGSRPRPHAREEIVIQGERGSITGDSEEMTVFSAEPHPRRIIPHIQGRWFPDAFGRSMAHFVDALDRGTPFLCSGRDNLKTVAIVEAAYRSIAERREVAIAEVI